MHPTCCFATPHMLLYFAYGANLSPNTLAKRGLGGLHGVPAQVADPHTCLAFAHRAGYATLLAKPPQQQLQWTSVASNEPAGAASLVFWQPHGVLYSLTPAQLQVLRAYEVGYRTQQVSVKPYHQQETVQATAFVSSPHLQLRSAVPPTQRYRNLIASAAQAQGLEGEYVRWLESLPAVPTRQLSQQQYNATLADLGARALAAGVLALACAAAMR